LYCQTNKAESLLLCRIPSFHKFFHVPTVSLSPSPQWLLLNLALGEMAFSARSVAVAAAPAYVSPISGLEKES
jgi:hypothetical protein